MLLNNQPLIFDATELDSTAISLLQNLIALDLDLSSDLSINSFDDFEFITLRGQRTDSLGTYDSNLELQGNVNIDLKGIAHQGYYTLPNSQNAIILSELVVDRASGVSAVKDIVLTLDSSLITDDLPFLGSLKAQDDDNDGIWEINSAASAASDFVNVQGDSAVTFSVLENDVDIDGDAIQLESFTPARIGDLKLVDAGTGTFSYTPNSDQPNFDYFTYAISDSNGSGRSRTGTVQLNVMDIDTIQSHQDDTASEVLLNMSPLAKSSLALDLGLSSDLSINSFDDFEYVTLRGQRTDSLGTYNSNLELQNNVNIDLEGIVRQGYYTLPNGQSAIILSELVVDRALGTSAVKDIVLTLDNSLITDDLPFLGTLEAQDDNSDGIWETNSAATAVDDTVRVRSNIPVIFTVLDNDTDIDGDAIEIGRFTPARIGKLQLLDAETGRFAYIPDADQTGFDYFTYTVSDTEGSERSNTGVVQLEIDTAVDTADPSTSPDLDSAPTSAPIPTAIQVEAEDMELLGAYRVESINAASGNKVISLRGGANTDTGSAVIEFSGADGKYDVTMAYFDENDGIGQLNLSKNGKQLTEVVMDQQLGSRLANSKTLVTTEIQGITISQGDRFTLTGIEDGSRSTAEHARVDYIEFRPAADIVTVVGGTQNERTDVPNGDTVDSVTGEGGALAVAAKHDLFEIGQSDIITAIDSFKSGDGLSIDSLSIPHIDDVPLAGVRSTEALFAQIEDVSAQPLIASAGEVFNPIV